MDVMKVLFKDVDAVLFDLDGTLVETNIDFPLMRSEMLRMADERGFSRERLSNKDILGIVECVEEELRLNGRGDEAGSFRAEAFSVLEEIELRHSENTKEIAFARELLDELAGRNIGVGIVTRNCRAASMISLGIVGIDCEVLLSRDDVRRTKPHPDQLMEALRLLDARAERAIMVGDHPMDIQAGKAAGMRTVGILAPGRPEDYFHEAAPDAVVTSLKELVDALIDSHS